MKRMFGLKVLDFAISAIDAFPECSHQSVEAIMEDGAPSGRKDFLIWDAPFIDPLAPGMGSHNPMSEATGLMRYLMKRGIRVILFCKVSCFRC